MAVPRALQENKDISEVLAMAIALRRYENQDYLGLYNMYLHFEPKMACQGLPPASPDRIHKWLNSLLAGSHNRHFVIESDYHVIGHGILCPNSSTTTELSLFLKQDFRGKHLGRELLVRLMHEACLCMHLKKVWVSVHPENGPIMRLAQQFDFKPQDSKELHFSEFILEKDVGHEVCLKSACPFYDACFPALLEDSDAAQKALDSRGNSDKIINHNQEESA